MAFGLGWPVFLRAYFGTSEVITTIMLNYIALYFVNFAIKRWLAPKGSDSSANIVPKASLRTPFFGTDYQSLNVSLGLFHRVSLGDCDVVVFETVEDWI